MWTLLPGIRQDHRGRRYRVAINSRGRQDRVYYQDTGAPPARTIPAPVLTQATPRRLLSIKGFDMTQRRMRIDFRVKGEREIRSMLSTNELGQVFVNQHRAICAWKWDEEKQKEALDLDQNGNPRKYQFSGSWDYFIQYHIDLKEESE